MCGSDKVAKSTQTNTPITNNPKSWSQCFPCCLKLRLGPFIKSMAAGKYVYPEVEAYARPNVMTKVPDYSFAKSKRMVAHEVTVKRLTATVDSGQRRQVTKTTPPHVLTRKGYRRLQFHLRTGT